MLRNLTSQDVAWILNQIGIVLKRRSKEDVFEGSYAGRTRVVIVPEISEVSRRKLKFDLETGRDQQRHCRKPVGKKMS